MKNIAALYLLLVLFYLCFISVVQAQADDRRPFKIGVILPLSGSLAFAGAEVRDSINLAASELKSPRFRFEFKFEDNGAGPAATASAARKLVDIDGVNALITLWPEAANVVAPITERSKLLHYTIAWDPGIACSHEFVFSHQVMVDDYVRATLELLQRHKITSVTFFHDSVFEQGADLLLKTATNYGIEVRKTFVFDRGKTDFRSELAKVRTDLPEGLLIWSIMPETEVFLKQVSEQQISLFVTGFFDVVQDLSLIEGKPFPSEVYATTDFQNQFKARYGRTTVMKGPNAYDIVKLIALAVERIQDDFPSAIALKHQLLQVSNYSGAVGKVSIDNCGNSSYPVVSRVASKGKLIILEE